MIFCSHIVLYLAKCAEGLRPYIFFNTFTLPLKKMYITQFQIEPIKRTDGIAFGSV